LRSTNIAEKLSSFVAAKYDYVKMKEVKIHIIGLKEINSLINIKHITILFDLITRCFAWDFGNPFLIHLINSNQRKRLENVNFLKFSLKHQCQLRQKMVLPNVVIWVFYVLGIAYILKIKRHNSKQFLLFNSHNLIFFIRYIKVN
jgi:hypothetical protein